jgi:acrylyl-CoA reductase (NADPH)
MDSLFKAFTVFENEDGSFKSEIISKSIDDLPPGDVLVRVDFSSLNYKDALSATGNKGVTKKYPHTPGIDAVGTVEDTSHSSFKIGDQVIVSGYDMGQNTAGGFGEYIRVPREWVALMPEGLTKKESIILGTAGMTAGLSLRELQKKNGIEGKLAIVTGATGGVGCLAVKLLSQLGADVTAVTGKVDSEDFLKSIGAVEVINRQQLAENFHQPLASGKWDIGVDVVGGEMLAGLMTCLKLGGSVACCGLVGGSTIETTIFPYILRGNSLIGIDSGNIPISEKEEIWMLFANEWKIELNDLSRTITLNELDQEIESILKGGQVGRVIVSLGEK